MHRIKNWVKNFFAFSRTETNAFLILIPLMILLIFSEPIYRYWFVRQPQDYSKEKNQLDSLLATFDPDSPDGYRDRDEEDSNAEKIKTETSSSPIKLFSFNPNSSSKEELMQLGFKEFLAKRIINYKDKGGKFFAKKDLMKIYGMDSSLYKKLYPFIDLPENRFQEKSIQKIEAKEKTTFTKTAFSKFDLNTADTSQLISVYGIGSKLSQRIISYREKLGGFISESQLKEVYGLDSSVVKNLLAKSFIDKNFQPHQLNINKATQQALAAHPYIKYKIAQAIVAYRFQHGDFKTIDALQKIVLIDKAQFEKMKPYLLNE
jgi:competence ComEA-like helix-hairpin-helix protein